MRLIQPVPLPEPGTGPRKATMVGAGEVPHLMQFARIVLPPGEVAPAHAHGDWTEVFYVQAGSAVMTVDEAPVRLSPGQCLCIGPGERHELRNDGDADFAMVFFSLRT
ncbi:MAG TPA: cupin domain-containing protein [Holophagaceae bacterium]|nr:cupin domain-containing protein [Holophagaceae bacterium]